MALQRHIALQSLSKQHHQGLLVSLLLEKGLKKKASLKEMRDFILQFWQDELVLHFELEETVLMPYAEMYKALMPSLLQMKQEHQEIKQIIHRINNEARAEHSETIAAFAGLIEKHIRFEERSLFNSLQEALKEDELKDVQKKLSVLPERDFCTRYAVKFWE